MKINQIEPRFARKLDHPLKDILQELRYLVPDNYQPRVSLLDASGRKKRSNASADKWVPESGRIEIRFEPTRSEKGVPVKIIRMGNYPYRKIANLYNSGKSIREISDATNIYASPGSKNKYARMNNIINKLKSGVKVGNDFIRVERVSRTATKRKGRTEIIRMNNYPYREIAGLYNSGKSVREISDATNIYASPGSKNKYARMNNIINKLKFGVKVGNEIVKVERRSRRVAGKSYRSEESETKTLDRIEGISAITNAERPADKPLRVTTNVHPADSDLLKVFVKALDRAESKPGWNFVSLKKFRDEVLPYEPFAAGAFQPTDVHWQNILRTAEERKLIVIGKVPNPKSPQFPVTSIRLNRLMPEVQEVLGIPKKHLGFHPIQIKGEPLSATILRERR